MWKTGNGHFHVMKEHETGCNYPEPIESTKAPVTQSIRIALETVLVAKVLVDGTTIIEPELKTKPTLDED